MLAFSDYPIPFEMSREGFVKKFIQKLNLSFNLSAGAFDGTSLVGFIFMTLEDYEGIYTAYNGGTGVLPEYRGRGITSTLFQYLKPRILLANAKMCILEVLTNNIPAIKVYERLEFKKVKILKCYQLLPYHYNPPGPNHMIRITNANKPDWGTYSSFFDFTPSFIDSVKMIDNNLVNESILEAKIKNEIIGYAVYQPNLGRISHFAVSPNYRNKGVGSLLMHEIYSSSKNKYLTIVNLPEQAAETQHFLTNLGFENQIDQYEMALSLVK